MENQGLQNLKEILLKRQAAKPPTFEWQDFALKVIRELGIPGFKRNAVFKVCKEHSKPFVEKALNETKELCKTGEKWKYFFKLAGSKTKKNPD